MQYFVGPSENINIHIYGDGIQMTDNRLEINYGEIIYYNTTLYSGVIIRE
jgi:hypothetical protein